MRTSRSQALKVFFNPETIAPFLVGSIVLAILGSVIYDILQNLFGSDTPGLLRIGAVALLILVFAVVLVESAIAQRLKQLPITVPFEVKQKQLDRQYKGLILLVSQPEACETAIRFHLPTLQRCWLISSEEKLDVAQNLCRRFPKVCVEKLILINDVYNPLEFHDRIDEIYRTRLPKDWRESDVIADYTGMTAHASVGMVLACVRTRRSLQYTPAKIDAQGKIAGSLNPIKVTLS